MKRQMKRAAIWMALPLITLAIASSATAAPTTNGDVVIAAVRGDFAPGHTAPVVMPQGGRLTLVNGDLSMHSVTAQATDSQGDALFSTGAVAATQSGSVEGVETLPTGTYGFACIYHSWMTGTLMVV
jgi:plastocyanin